MHLGIQNFDPTLTRLINLLKSKEQSITGYKENEIFRILLHDIYYFEVVDRKVYVNSIDNSYQIKERLYQVEEKYSSLNYIRISKSVIVNIDKIKSIYPSLSGAFELKLKNEEILKISRFYVTALKSKLGMGE